MYHHALKAGGPAFDPSWMWDELGLENEVPSHPPPLAHERVAALAPGSGEIGRSIAAELRQEPGFDDASSIAGEERLRASLDLQRLIREGTADKAERVTWPRPGLPAYLELMVNFELHRRKSFWVDGSLAYMLAHTDLDVRGRQRNGNGRERAGRRDRHPVALVVATPRGVSRRRADNPSSASLADWAFG
jgi:hypothetical protein